MSEFDYFGGYADPMGGDFDGEGDFDGDIHLVPERNAFERAGLSRGDEILRTLIGSGGKIPGSLEEMNKRLYRMMISDEERLKTFVSIYFERFRETLGMTEGDFSVLMDKILLLPKIKTTNPVGYVLGYYLVDRNGRISRERFKRVDKEVIPYISEVKAPDVIRYARLWTERLT